MNPPRKRDLPDHCAKCGRLADPRCPKGVRLCGKHLGDHWIHRLVTGPNFDVVDPHRVFGKNPVRRNPRKVKGKSTTLHNMASVTITKQRNGVVLIRGRRKA